MGIIHLSRFLPSLAIILLLLVSSQLSGLAFQIIFSATSADPLPPPFLLFFFLSFLFWQTKQPGSQYWQGKPKRSQENNNNYVSEWCLAFGAPLALSAVALTWHKASLPERLTLRRSADGGLSWTEVASHLVPPLDSAEMYLSLPAGLPPTTNLILTFVGFAKCNTTTEVRA